jgi:cytochrome c oxidase cbb3-type subunit 4
MNMDFVNLLSDMRSVVTLVSMATFIGIVLWAYSARRKNDFDEAARLPFADEEDLNKTEGEPRHG